ncbi:MAG: hypothetical protein ACOCRO_10795 [Halanaerobiales bacterium]
MMTIFGYTFVSLLVLFFTGNIVLSGFFSTLGFVIMLGFLFIIELGILFMPVNDPVERER